SQEVVGDLVGSNYNPIYKAAFGSIGSSVLVSASNPLPVTSIISGPFPLEVGDGTNTIEVVQEGNRYPTTVADPTSRDLLKEILLELKILNVHLHSITDEQVGSADILEN
ncbi:hypothetical protein KAR91_77420, partial [Candidatus Pacearchaeota archaeon]|nr:hypothetical protein [Candidatus Pacearchaeota archaeon]